MIGETWRKKSLSRDSAGGEIDWGSWKHFRRLSPSFEIMASPLDHEDVIGFEINTFVKSEV